MFSTGIASGTHVYLRDEALGSHQQLISHFSFTALAVLANQSLAR